VPGVIFRLILYSFDCLIWPDSWAARRLCFSGGFGPCFGFGFRLGPAGLGFGLFLEIIFGSPLDGLAAALPDYCRKLGLAFQ
jgi:hypothetical protein